MDFEFEILRAYVREKRLCEEEEQEGEEEEEQEGEENCVIISIMLFMKEDTYVLLVDLSWMWFTYLKLMCIRDVV